MRLLASRISFVIHLILLLLAGNGRQKLEAVNELICGKMILAESVVLTCAQEGI